MSKPMEVNDANFEAEVLQSDVPVLVDFWAPWCGPCRTIAPALEQLAKDYDGQFKVAKVNVDENQQYAAQLGVRGIPAMFLFRDGQMVDQMVGALPKPAIEERVKKVLATPASA